MRAQLIGALLASMVVATPVIAHGGHGGGGHHSGGGHHQGGGHHGGHHGDHHGHHGHHGDRHWNGDRWGGGWNNGWGGWGGTGEEVIDESSPVYVLPQNNGTYPQNTGTTIEYNQQVQRRNQSPN